MIVDIEKYDLWRKSQACVDCGELPGVTEVRQVEIQCDPCRALNGPCEERGYRAIDFAVRDGIVPQMFGQDVRSRMRFGLQPARRVG